MKRLAGGLARTVASPFAGVYAFLALLMLALFTGERDPMSFLLNRMFPPPDDYGVSLTRLFPIKPTREPSQDSSQWLLLIRHSDSATRLVEVVDVHSRRSTHLAVGSIDGVVLPRLVESDAIPRAIAQLSLPGETIATVLITAERTEPYKLTLLTPTIQKKIHADGDLAFFSPNELRNLRAVYYVCVFVSALLAFTLPKFGRLLPAVTIEQAAVPELRPSEERADRE